VGWVTTTFSAENTFPPPTGISLVLASVAFPLLPATRGRHCSVT
jgi:hypothetical protein